MMNDSIPVNFWQMPLYCVVVERAYILDFSSQLNTLCCSSSKGTTQGKTSDNKNK